MSSALINPNGRISTLLNFEAHEGVEHRVEGMSLLLTKARVEAATGTKEGEVIEDGCVKPNQTVFLKFGTVRPDNCEVLVSIHPDLARKAQVTGPSILRAGESTELFFTLSAFKSLDIGNFSTLATLIILR